ncbi:MAG TPA: hypothetical protein VK891_08565 [Euzebyales bacterium]|nr:hypothetical protein [Euzebyales bacterium]
METPRTDHANVLVSDPMASTRSTVVRLLAPRLERGTQHLAAA